MPALIDARPLPESPDCTAYEISGRNPADVQAAIDHLMGEPGILEAHFRHPKRDFLEGNARWRSRGYVRGAQ